jgi:dTMP kinase
MLFITFEGIDGSGKSTQASILVKRLQGEGHIVHHLREPGGTTLGESIRGLLLDSAHEITPRAEMLLFSAARAQLTDEVIRPALERGEIIVCDRFFDSTTVYQGVARGLGELEWMRMLHQQVTGGLAPDITFFLDLPHGAASSRRDRRGEADRMESAGDDFMADVARGYRDLARAEPGRIYSVSAERTVAAIAEEIWAEVLKKLILTSGTGG